MFVLVKLNILLLLIVFIYSCDADYKKGKATTITLNDGNEIPVIGFGTSARVNTFNEVRHSVESAIDEGYRHIDTAAYYDTEGIVGDALKSKIQDGTVRREDLFITTKLWNDKHKEEEVVPALRTSLRKLGLNFVDLYLIHWPMSTDEHDNDIKYDYIYTWKGMEEAQRLGLAKSIGVSNFNQTQLERLILNGRVKPAVNQIEVNPNLSQKDLIKYCHDNDIHVVAYAPLGSMTPKHSKNKPNPPPPRLDDPLIKAIGEKYNKTVVQTVLRYLLDRNLIAIPMSVKPHRIRENIDIFDFKLSETEIQQIDAFNINHRVVPYLSLKHNIHYPFYEIWDKI